MSGRDWPAVVAELAERPELHDSWLGGISYNPAATGSVLTRLWSARDRLSAPTYWVEYRTLSADAGSALAAIPDRGLRKALALNPTLDLDSLKVLAADPGLRLFVEEGVARRGPDDDWERAAEAVFGPRPAPAPGPDRPAPGRPALTRAEAEELVGSPNAATRATAAWDPRVPQDLALTLAEDADPEVRVHLSLREDLTDDQRMAVPWEEPRHHHHVPEWLTLLQQDPAGIAHHAGSAHCLIRRGVAAARHLPPETVARLAADDDFFVRLTLAQLCDDAPHDLIMEMYRTWNGLTWIGLESRPNFVRPGMAADYVGHPHERTRRAALFDPLATPEAVEELSRDTGPAGSHALADPRLPIGRLQEALGGRGAGSAARNPQVPDSVLHRLLDFAGVERPEDAAPPAVSP